MAEAATRVSVVESAVTVVVVKEVVAIMVVLVLSGSSNGIQSVQVDIFYKSL